MLSLQAALVSQNVLFVAIYEAIYTFIEEGERFFNDTSRAQAGVKKVCFGVKMEILEISVSSLLLLKRLIELSRRTYYYSLGKYGQPSSSLALYAKYCFVWASYMP